MLFLISFLLAALPLYRELSQHSDIWWTPHTMLVPLAQGRDRVEVYARGKPLDALLDAGQLQTSQAGGASTLAKGDVGLRFNNRDRIRVQHLPLLLLDAATCGAIACLFLMFVTGRIEFRQEVPGPAEVRD
jgi:hypothetical protein